MRDISRICSRDLGDFAELLVGQLMRERDNKIGPFKNLPRKSQLDTLNQRQRFHLHRSILLDWMHFQTRCVAAVPRMVCRAAFDPGVYAAVVQEIENDLKKGNSLKPRVSRQILKRLKTPKLRADPLLWHWNIHHFHLGEFDGELGYASGTDDLLFVYADGQSAVVLGIAPHHEIGSDWLLSRLFSTAPELVEKFKIHGIESGAHQYSASQRKKVWRGVNLTYEYNGTVIFPPGSGVTSSGHSLRLKIAEDRLLNAILLFDRRQPYILRKPNLAGLSFDGVCLIVREENGQILLSEALV